MPKPSSAQVVNRLIDNLPREQRQLFLAQCTHRQLVFGEVLYAVGAPVTHVHFPLTGFISLVAPIAGHEPLEVGMVGNEGMLGATLVLGVDVAPISAVVQGPGATLEITAAEFCYQLGQSPALQRTLGAYLYVQIQQLTQNSVCNSFHEVIARLARWLLMTHDRTQGDGLQLTHLFLAEMLGVRRSAVTIAAGELRRRKLIRYARGQIRIISRSGLESVACVCYVESLRAYDRCLPLSASSEKCRPAPL